MTISENDTPADSGTENATPSTADTSNDWDYFDPDEDRDTEGTPEPDETESEVETDDESEPVETEDDPDDQAEETPASDEEEPGEPVKDDVKVTLADGKEVALGELKKGYLRQADYSRKTLETSEKTKDLTAKADRIERTVEVFADFLSKQIPDEPDIGLSMSNPGAYVQQKAAYEATMAQINALIEFAREPQAVKQEIAQSSSREQLLAENERLAEAFPDTRDPEKRKAFFDRSFSAARELGFGDQELQNVSDHRMFALAHWAKRGMEAAKASKAAKTKVAGVPPVAKPRRPNAQASAAKNGEAMRRLSKSGSLKDALLVDFD